MARDGKRMLALSTDNKTEVLRKLQESVHFEKRLATSNVLGYKQWAEMSLPSWFVKEHGDKIREEVILRSYTKSWDVGLSISTHTQNTCARVKFASGWRAFVTSNGLAAGDSVIFALTADSEFEVYLFRREAVGKNAFQASRKRANESRHDRVVDEGDTSGLNAKKKRAVGEVRLASASGHGPRSLPSTGSESFLRDLEKELDSGSCDLHFSLEPASDHDKLDVKSQLDTRNGPQSSFGSLSLSWSDSHLLESKNERDRASSERDVSHEPASDHDKLDAMSELGARDGPVQCTRSRTKEDNEYPALALEKKSRNSPGFYKILAASNFHTYSIEIPGPFWKTYSKNLCPKVKLQGIWEESAVRTVTCSVTSYEGQIRVFLRTGWKGFSKENNLEVGQELLFTLVGDSFFTVREVLANGEETQS